ncbi:hypothetical protein Cgig2_028468 [Carnegiea gigantea]|uniref:Uncharacterized protein n=1 Tax=Carnegiea gigantea TaxID=171969 RepID=A0A9Q1K9Z1_9CARY|nr:hypothetical protein Cgig2_028468 [Carnegiea gigantea]
MNREARLFCEEYFSKLNEVIEVKVGSVYMEGDVQQDGSSSTKSVLNPPGSREKNQRNKRLKSTSEKKCNQAKARKKKKMSAHNLQVKRDYPRCSGIIQAFSTLIHNGVPLCMNGPYGGSSSQDDVVPILNLLSNSNLNDRSLRQVSSCSYMVILGFTCYCSICNIFIF